MDRRVPEIVLPVLPVLLALVLPVLAAPEDTLRAEIDNLLRPDRRGNVAAAAERLRPWGDEAVVRLIARYEASDSDWRSSVPAVLCHLGTDRALAFVLALAGDRPEAPGVDRAVRAFPVEQEDRLLPPLIRNADSPALGWEIRERLTGAVLRQPSRAGLLVAALRDEPEAALRMRRLHEVLGRVAGYAAHWYVLVERDRPAQASANVLADRNAFWRGWWGRNREKSRLEWLDEPLAAPGGPRSAAARALASLDDTAATSRLVGLLDDAERSVRYWAVVGLKTLEGSLPEAGYPGETFTAEEAVEIPRLKRVFGG